MAKHKAASLQARLHRKSNPVDDPGIAQHKRIMDTTTEADVLGDLHLSAIEYRDPRELKPSPYNETFEGLKDKTYWVNLRNDIEEAGAITDPLLILADGEIVSGHSRLRVALTLLDEGRREFEKIPVRIIQSELTEAEKRKRVYLGNLSRFEIDTNTRLRLYADIYPDYFASSDAGKPGKRETVSRISRKNIAEGMGISERQTANERAIYQDAKQRAAAQGRAAPDTGDIETARKVRNTARRKPKRSPAQSDIQRESSDTPDVFDNAPLLQPLDLLRKDVETAFTTTVRKALATKKPLPYLEGIETVARQLHRTLPMRKTLDLIEEHRKRGGTNAS